MATKLCLINLLGGATVTSSVGAVANFSHNNVKNYDYDLVAKYSRRSTVTITLSLSSRQIFNCIVVDRHNAGSVAMRLYHDNSLLRNVSGIQTTNLSGRHGFTPSLLKRSSVFFPATNANRIQVTFNSLPNNGIIGYIMGGPEFNPVCGAQPGSQVSSNIISNISPSPSGIAYPNYSGVKNNGIFIFNFLTDGEAANIKSMTAFSAASDLPVFGSLFEGAGGNIESMNEILGYVDRIQGPAEAPNGNAWQCTLTIVEGSRNLA